MWLEVQSARAIKITGNHKTYERMKEDMDFDAGPVLAGQCTQDELADQLTQMVVDVAGGACSKSEALRAQGVFHSV